MQASCDRVREKIKNISVELMLIMNTKFAFCRPDFKHGLVWCQHFNGSWAPPFTMDEYKSKKPPEESSKDDNLLEDQTD
jgi:hypothetical protein